MKRTLILTLSLLSLLTPAVSAQQGSPAAGSVTALGSPRGWAYAFLQSPFLIGRNWVFSAPGVVLLAETPGALAGKLGRPGVDAQGGLVSLYAAIGEQGWELVQCGEGVLPGFPGPACVFRQPQ